MDTGNCIVYIKTDYRQKDIVKDIGTRFDTSNYELDRPLSQGKNKKAIALMKDELRQKIMIRFLLLTEKTYSYLVEDGKEYKRGISLLNSLLSTQNINNWRFQIWKNKFII